MTASRKFQFPINAEGGESEGLNIHGINFFRENPIKHLSRETIQNILDASDDSSTPVIAEFKHRTVPAKRLPGRESLEEAFSKCLTNSDQSESDDEFFDTGKKILEEDSVDVLTISDYNTVGLRGIKNNTDEWKKLITKSGSSNKNDNAGGAFGVGKNATFACSNLHTVYYNTLNIDGESGFQGIAKLASHSRNEDIETRATGFYRYDDGSPIMEIDSDLEEFSSRDKEGTDIHIVGFKYPDSWKEQVIKTVLDNFFVAIYEGKIEIIVDGEHISKDSLAEIIDKYMDGHDEFYTSEFFAAFIQDSDECTHRKIQLNSINGEISLFLKEGDKQKSSRTVARFRDIGMKIDELKGFPQRFYFSGVMVAGGDDLNALLRKTEPPTHHKWIPSFHKDEKKAERVLAEIRKEIKGVVKELSKKDEKESVDIEGLNDFLPNLSDVDNPFDELNEREGDYPTDIYVKPNQPQPKKRKKKRKTRTPRKPREKRSTIPKIDRIRVRGYKEEGSYLITLHPKKDAEGVIEIKVVGEDSKTYDSNFKSVTIKDTNQAVEFDKHGTIGPLMFEESSPLSLVVTMEDKLRHSLEVNVR